MRRRIASLVAMVMSALLVLAGPALAQYPPDDGDDAGDVLPTQEPPHPDGDGEDPGDEAPADEASGHEDHGDEGPVVPLGDDETGVMGVALARTGLDPGPALVLASILVLGGTAAVVAARRRRAAGRARHPV
jgi:hypothetical protein